MVAVSPFVGLRFASDRDPELQLERVTAPPYDAIDRDLARKLHTSSPYNIVRLELASAAGDSGHDPYRAAAATFRRWRAEGALERDPEATLRVYEHRYRLPDGRPARQVGVLAALQLAPWDAGDVLPHEEVFRAPVEDRLRLLEALPVNLSPIYVVTEHPVPSVRDALDRVMAQQNAEQFVDENGVEHRVWTTSDATVHEQITGGLRTERVLMADGHHRYTTALEHASRYDIRGQILALVVIPAVSGSTASGEAHEGHAHDGPWVHAMHRGLRRWPDDAERRLAAEGFQVSVAPGGAAAHQRGIETATDARFGILTAERRYVVTLPAAHADRRGRGELPTTVVDRALVEIIGIDPEHDLRYLAGTQHVGGLLAADDTAAVVLVPAVGIERVWETALSGDRMPPKSTAFFPKPRTGIVLRPVEVPFESAAADR